MTHLLDPMDERSAYDLGYKAGQADAQRALGRALRTERMRFNHLHPDNADPDYYLAEIIVRDTIL